jgi:hypothetical protein
MPSKPLQQHWQVISPRKVFFLHGTGGKVPVKALATSDILDDLTSFDPTGPNPTRGLDWFAPEVRPEMSRLLDINSVPSCPSPVGIAWAGVWLLLCLRATEMLLRVKVVILCSTCGFVNLRCH